MFAAADEGTLEGSGPDHFVCDIDRGKNPRACIVDIKTDGMGHAKMPMYL